MAYYAWTEIRSGGDVEQRPASGNRVINVVTNRNIIPAGEKITQKDANATDEEWQSWIDGGSVREYPMPEGTDEYTSPAAVVVSNLVDDDGNIDINKLIEVGMAQPEAVPVEEEGTTQTQAKPKADVPKGA